MSLEEKREKINNEVHDTEIGNYDNFNKSLERKIVWKYDIYLLRNAVVAGFDAKYLNTNPIDFNWAVASLLVSYLIFEIPSNLVNKILGFHVWIPIIMVCWGIASMCQAAVTTVIQLGIVRFILGMAEAGFPPSVLGYLSLYYARKEMTLRYSVFLIFVNIAGAISGILAYFLVQVQGPLKGFQWLFIIDGIPTIILAIVIAIFLTSGPGNARFLTPQERIIAVDRLKSEGGPGEVDRSTARAQIKRALTDIRVYIYFGILGFGSIPSFALSFFLPVLVKQLGYNDVQAQLMTVPPFIFATICMTIISWLSDKYQIRAWSIVAGDIMSIVGFAGIVATSAIDKNLYNLRYFFTTLLACGVCTVLPVAFSWLTCNIVGQYKRNVAIGLVMASTYIGGIVGVLIFPLNEAPSFYKGNMICLIAVIIQCILAIILKFHLDHINKKRDLDLLSRHNVSLNGSELRNSKKIRELAMKLVEHEPKCDE
ncbi:13630_t:CDS:2, partial [Racocetra persica]